MKTKLLAALAFCVLASPSIAQQWVKTQPLPSTTLNGDKSSTIAVTNTFQVVFTAAGNVPNPTPGFGGERHGCSIQNNGTHSMYVNEGTPIASATTSNTWVLTAGQLFNCNFNGVVLSGEIDITGTSGDAYVAKQF